MVVVTGAPVLPAWSAKLMLKVAGSFGVLPSTGRTTTQSIPLPLVFEAVTDDPARVTVGAGMGSLEVKERVRLSPDFARLLESLLFDASWTGIRVGGSYPTQPKFDRWSGDGNSLVACTVRDLEVKGDWT